MNFKKFTIFSAIIGTCFTVANSKPAEKRQKPPGFDNGNGVNNLLRLIRYNKLKFSIIQVVVFI